MDDRIGRDALDALRERLDANAWTGVSRLEEQLLVWRFLPHPAALPGWRSERVRQLELPEWPAATRSTWRPVDQADDVLLTVDTFECADLRTAHAWLLRVLAHVESTAIARLEEREPGDVAFAAAGAAALTFARANLVVSMSNGGRSVVPLVDPALVLDRWISGRREPGGRAAPEFRTLELESSPEREGEVIRLRSEAREPEDRHVWFAFHARTGELSLADGQPAYRFAGRPDVITVHAIGPGGVSVRTVELPGRPESRTHSPDDV